MNIDRFQNENRPLRRKPMIHRVRARGPPLHNENLPPSVARRRGRGQRNPVNSARHRINTQNTQYTQEDLDQIRAASQAGITILGMTPAPNGVLFDILLLDCESAIV